MSYLEGVYWDLDGTIANTELEAHLPAFNKAFKYFDLNWYWDKDTYINLLKINGGRNRISYFSKIRNESISDDLIIEIHKKKQYYYLELVENDLIKLKCGVSRLVDELFEKKVRQFIVTSSSRVQVEVLLTKLFPNSNPFDFCITSEDVHLHKPDPLPYLQAIKLSGIKRDNSVVFEDSVPGLMSSLTSGLPTICVKTNIPVKFNNSKLTCLVDTLGDSFNPTTFIIGSNLNCEYVSYEYLNNFLN